MNRAPRTLVLASRSPARLATLRSAGVEPMVVVSGVDEDQLGPLPPAELALQLAELKCAAVAERDDLPEGFEHVSTWVFVGQGYLDLDSAAAAVTSAALARTRKSSHNSAASR